MVTSSRTADAASGDIALAFANAHGALAAPAALVEWLSDRQLLDETVLASLGPPELRRLHSEGIRLHGTVLSLLHGLAEERPLDAPACFEINRVLEAATWHRRIELDGAGGSIHESLRPSTLPGLLAPIALAVAALAESAPGGRLRTCAAEACARWFLDTSKGGRRRWCSMATCGNRAKAARWRAT